MFAPVLDHELSLYVIRIKATRAAPRRTQRLAGIARAAILALLGLAPAGLASCSTTKPYQRETLARPEMAPDGDADREALRHHVLSTREGAVGGFGGGGGGCGCN